jgi:class 3 adenylate cyclase
MRHSITAATNIDSASVNQAEAVAQIRAHLDRGAPWDACDAFHDAVARGVADGELYYWGALALARAGATRTAQIVLDGAVFAPDSDRAVDVASLRGRLWKDAYEHAADDASAHLFARRARDEYLRAYGINGDRYPAVNAATLSLLLGDVAEARRLASEIVEQQSPTAEARNAWHHATFGEAELLRGRVELSTQHYREAFRLCGESAGIVASMRRQLRLLAPVLADAAAMLSILPAPSVVAFAGHMIDHPNRAAPRFPQSMSETVARQLHERVREMRAPIIYTSAACGSDLLLIEVAKEMAAEVNIVLPFDRDDFVRTSVALAGDDWVRRFEVALERANRVIMATEEGYLGDNALFEHASLLVDGLAVLRAQQLHTDPTLLCVLDTDEGARVGGTRATVERWRRTLGEPIVIDLRELRQGQPGADRPAISTTSAGLYEPMPAATADTPRRELRTMLFADFAGYSRLHDAFAPLFQQRFLEICATELDASTIKPLEAKTWGDALYAVFASASEGAEFALSFLERMLDVDWTTTGLPDTSQVRVALHAGPVYRGHDPVMNADSHFGSAVVRAARIEPVTPPGMVYASEAFAATLAGTGQRDYLLEYIGTMALAKGYGESRLYRLERCRFR